MKNYILGFITASILVWIIPVFADEYDLEIKRNYANCLAVGLKYLPLEGKEELARLLWGSTPND